MDPIRDRDDFLQMEKLDKPPSPKPLVDNIAQNALKSENDIPKPLFSRTITHIKNYGGFFGWVKKLFVYFFPKASQQTVDFIKDQVDLEKSIITGESVKLSRKSGVIIEKGILTPPGIENIIINKSHYHTLAESNLTEWKKKLDEKPLTSKVSEVEVQIQAFGRDDSEKPMTLGHLNPTGLASSHLKNLYKVSHGNTVSFRSAVIDSKIKARDFSDAVRDASPDKKSIRVVSHMLCSFERKNESRMIKRQKGALAFENRDGMQIAHLNTATNRFYDTHRFWHKIFPSSTDYFLKGELRSRQHNTEALATYLKWFLDDAAISLEGDLPVVGSKRYELDNLLERANELNKNIFDSNKGARRLKKNQLGDVQKQLTEILQEYIKAAEQIENTLSLKGDKNLAQTNKILSKLLKSQLEDDSNLRLGRPQEQMLYKDLNRRLNIVSQVNCKSGLDRTGQSSSLEISLDQLRALHPEKSDLIDDIILNWDEKNRAYIAADNYETPELKLIHELKNIYLYNLIKIGLPITFRSTALMGLKWNKGFQAQLIPLDYLPKKIEVGYGNFQPLVNYNAEGEPIGLTKVGERLLIRLSAHRGD